MIHRRIQLWLIMDKITQMLLLGFAGVPFLGPVIDQILMPHMLDPVQYPKAIFPALIPLHWN